MKKILLLLLIGYQCFCYAQQTAFERHNNMTATYEEVVLFYQELDDRYEACSLLTYGITDSGKPLHLFVIAKDGNFDPKQIQRENKIIALINNGIHPGEPEGIDASMMLARNLLQQGSLPDNVIICIIPVYNIGGMLNRGVSRVNQNGPEVYGFRGNSRNLDLNRDFIKTDSRNSRVFQEIFHQWKPHVFMDTHASNGADYQYIMTLIDTQRDKLHPALQDIGSQFTSTLYDLMERSGFEMIPYVSFRQRTPASGIVSFLENPRYSTGYAALHHTIGYMPETHMWKPYHQRVQSTYTLLQHFINVADEHVAEISFSRQKALEQSRKQTDFVLSWQLDTSRWDTIIFKGFESGTKPSDVSGLSRLYYDRNKPYTITIPYFNRYKPAVKVEKPYAYIIPQAWHDVVDLLRLNGTEIQQLEQDTVLELEMYYITDYQTARNPYEGHYPHSQVQVKPQTQHIQCYAGDYAVITNQTGNRYIVETLEPHAPDSFFNWNFFDSILSQKEYFSDYIFEDEAFRLLQGDSEFKKAFESAKAKDENLRNSGREQLDWIYKQSNYYEKTHLRYPIGRLKTAVPLNMSSI